MTPRTRAILVTHMNGLSAPMADYLKIAERHPHPKYGPPKVIGDAARALGGGYQGAKIGKQGWMTVFSLHTMKMMTTLGEGGMITTDDPDLMLRLRAIRQWGIAVSEDLEIARGKKGTGDMGWGSNYKMTKIQAAVGLVQLRRLDSMIAPRVALAKKRTEMLRDVPELTLPFDAGGIRAGLLPLQPAGAAGVGWREARSAHVHSPEGVRRGYRGGQSAGVSDRCLRPAHDRGAILPAGRGTGGAPLQHADAPADVRRGQRIHLRGDLGGGGSGEGLRQQAKGGAPRRDFALAGLTPAANGTGRGRDRHPGKGRRLGLWGR